MDLEKIRILPLVDLENIHVHFQNLSIMHTHSNDYLILCVHLFFLVGDEQNCRHDRFQIKRLLIKTSIVVIVPDQILCWYVILDLVRHHPDFPSIRTSTEHSKLHVLQWQRSEQMATCGIAHKNV